MGAHNLGKERRFVGARLAKCIATPRMKARATTLIQRYAGSHWREAQRAGWIIDVVTHIDRDYREYILDQVCSGVSIRVWDLFGIRSFRLGLKP